MRRINLFLPLTVV